jgi:hypothetical protein
MVREMHPITFGVALFVAVASGSPFNSYSVFLSPRKLPGACVSGELDEFRNRTYAFRTDKVYPWGESVTLSNGKFIEHNPFGTPEWEISLVSAEAMSLFGRRPALLVLGAEHLNGTGGGSHVMAECRDRNLFTLFEASGEGVREATFAPGRGLTVTRWVWSSTDAHCCPSRQVEERYDWRRSGGRFVRVSRVERSAPK